VIRKVAPSPQSTKPLPSTLPKGYYRVSELNQFPKVQWQVEGIWERHSLAFVYGLSGCMKSHFVLDYLCCIATGTPWHGRDVNFPGRVVYVVAESINNLQDRINKWSDEHDDASPEDHLFIRDGLDLTDDEAFKKFKNELKGLAPEVVAFSPLYMMSLGLDENSVRDMGRLLMRFEELRRDLKTQVVVEHHTSASGERPRGHSVLQNIAFTGILVKMSAKAVVTASCEKQRNAAKFEDMSFIVKADSPTAPAVLIETGVAARSTTRRPDKRAALNDRKIIGFLENHGPSTFTQLVDGTEMSKSSVGNVRDRLLERGILVMADGNKLRLVTESNTSHEDVRSTYSRRPLTGSEKAIGKAVRPEPTGPGRTKGQLQKQSGASRKTVTSGGKSLRK
jgi:hypothetical protein